ncbi:MAG: RNA pseudouridine synthase, partial [Halioglobus sp.]|nr:RNA pseudouridine synthase [Halioglobus sp.]
DRTRLLLKPVTGRSHQLRIHLRELGHPILGCDLYAHAEALGMASRLMLHASRLELRHPRSGTWLVGECPPDF